MKLTKRTIAGIKAMIAIEKEHDKKKDVVSSNLIHDKTKVPIKFLEQALLMLKNAGLIKSVRGAKGGYFITDRKVNLLDIVTAMDDSILIKVAAPKQSAYMKACFETLEYFKVCAKHVSLKEMATEKKGNK